MPGRTGSYRRDETGTGSADRIREYAVKVGYYAGGTDSAAGTGVSGIGAHRSGQTGSAKRRTGTG